MREMTWKLLLGSLLHRKGRVAISVSAVALGVSLIVAAVNLGQGIRGKLGEELRNYGANLLLVPGVGSGTHLKAESLLLLEEKRLKDRLAGYAPFLYSVVKVQGRDVVLVGTHFPSVKKISTWWQVGGKWPEKSGEVLVGSNVASKLGLRLEENLGVSYKRSSSTFSIAGILATGGAEENQVFAPLENVQLLTGLHGSLNSVLVSGRAEKGLDETVSLLRQAWPEAEVRTLLQVAEAEESVLSRLEILLILVSLLVLLASGLSIFATMTTSAMERRVEIALMRALGAEKMEVGRIFASEALGIGVIGGVLGWLFGLFYAEIIGLSVFRSLIPPSLVSLPTGLVIGLGVAFLSSLSIVRKVANMAPAPVLRGK
jgi:putative ABC transport system permease protein